VKYLSLIGPLIEAVNELRAQVQSQQARIDELEHQVGGR
jgi:hypothetical protein